MRNTVLIGVALVLAALAWMAWPLVALYGLARAVEARDVAAVMERVDIASIHRSLIGQIATAYNRVTGETAQRNTLFVVVTSTVADALIVRMVASEAFAALLHAGWVDTALAERPSQTSGLSRQALGGPWQVFLNSEQGFDRYTVSFPTDMPAAQRFELRWHLEGWRWRVAEVMLPQELADQLALKLAKAQPPTQ